MVVQIVGNRVVGGATYVPPPEPTNNPNVFTRIKEPTARNWDNLGRPTNLPQMTPSSSLTMADRLAGRSTPQLTPPGSGTTYVPATRNYVPLSSRLSGARTPAIVPSGVPTAAAQAEALIIPRAAGLRIPAGAGSAAIGLLFSLPTELPRLMGLLSNPQQYWREQEEQRRRELPWLYPRADTARTGLGARLRSPLPVAPFQGGQTPNASYNVGIELQTFGSDGTPSGSQSYRPTVPGPISGVRATPSPDRNVYFLEVLSNGAWVAFNVTARITSDGTVIKVPIISITGVSRADGQPDTGGNPAPVVRPSDPPRPALAHNTAPHSRPTPSPVPNAVPLNAPHLINPQTGARIAPNTGTDTASRPSTAPATTPNPFSPASTIAPKITPEQLKRVAPSSLIPDSQATPAIAAQPHTGFSNRSSNWGVRLGQEGLYGESAAEYWHRNSSPVSANPNPIPSGQLRETNGTTPGLLPVAAIGIGILGGYAASNFGSSRASATTRSPAPGTGTTTGIAGDPDITPIGGTAPNTPGFCRFAPDPYSAQTNRRTGRIERVDIAIQTYQTAMLTKLDTKMGPELPNGGIAGKLGRMAGLASKTWNFLQVDRALAVFTWIGVLHNAYMLSNNLTQTLFSAISTGLDAIGIQKTDAEGNESPYDVGEIVTKYTEGFFKSVFGTSNVDGIKEQWIKYNRIYQSAMNIIYTVNSIVDSTRSIVEAVGENVSKVGNALKRSGTVMENSFGWMQEKFSALSVGNNRWEKMFSNIERAENVTSSGAMVASDFVSIQDSLKQVKTNRAELNASLKAVGYGTKNPLPPSPKLSPNTK